eukprot:6202224-Pleurochrysis_carterae.AAC.3
MFGRSRSVPCLRQPLYAPESVRTTAILATRRRKRQAEKQLRQHGAEAPRAAHDGPRHRDALRLTT